MTSKVLFHMIEKNISEEEKAALPDPLNADEMNQARLAQGCILYNRVSQNEPVHMMGEVIIKWFYFYYFRFRQLFERALLKNQNQNLFKWGAVNLRNAAENYKKKIRGFFGWIKIWKIM